MKLENLIGVLIVIYTALVLVLLVDAVDNIGFVVLTVLFVLTFVYALIYTLHAIPTNDVALTIHDSE